MKGSPRAGKNCLAETAGAGGCQMGANKAGEGRSCRQGRWQSRRAGAAVQCHQDFIFTIPEGCLRNRVSADACLPQILLASGADACPTTLSPVLKQRNKMPILMLTGMALPVYWSRNEHWGSSMNR
jgi:hypothetical protein